MGDYNVAPGLGLYAEVDMTRDVYGGGISIGTWDKNNATIFIMGANVSF